MNRKLRRTVYNDAWFGGVCAGVAYWIGCPVWIVRLVWTVAIVGYGFGLLAYILLFIFLPVWEKTPADFHQVTGD